MTGSKKDYFSSREAAELLGVAVSTIQLWTNNGLLRAWTTGGGHRRIACASVNDMLKEQQAIVSGGASKKDKLSIVIVEDNAQQLRLYAQQFRAWKIDADIITATDGYEGLVKIGQNLPDIIIADLMMPRLDGFEMIKALTELPEVKDSLIIVITGISESQIKAKGGLPKEVHIFMKPIDFADMEKLLREKEQQVVSPTQMNVRQTSLSHD